MFRQRLRVVSVPADVVVDAVYRPVHGVVEGSPLPVAALEGACDRRAAQGGHLPQVDPERLPRGPDVGVHIACVVPRLRMGVEGDGLGDHVAATAAVAVHHHSRAAERGVGLRRKDHGRQEHSDAADDREGDATSLCTSTAQQGRLHDTSFCWCTGNGSLVTKKG